MDRIQRFVFEHRRLLAALFSGLAVLAALSSLRQAPAQTDIIVARRDLSSGHVVTTSDLRTASVPPDAAPPQRLRRDQAVGRRVAGPMREGETLTDFRVLEPGALAGYGDAVVLTTIRVDRADGAAGVQVGDRVDVVAVDPDGESAAEIVARGVEIVTVPTETDSEVTALGVVTSEKNALALATAGLSARFSVITSSQ